jgi:competence protein ComEC
VKKYISFLATPTWVLVFCPLLWGQTLTIYHVDVDQGDSTLIVSPSGKTLLIDGGDTGKGMTRVVPLLQSLKIRSLDYTVATHYDADHIGGLDEVIQALGRRISVQAFDRGEAPEKTKAYKDYVAAVGEHRKEIKPGDTIGLGPDIDVICVAVNQQVVNGSKIDPPLPDENGNSVALLIRFKDFDYFIGGDLTGGGKSGSKRTPDVESLVGEAIGDVDVLRVSHHGSQTSSNQNFLAVLHPEVAVISVGNGGKNLRYHHPHRIVLTRLRSLPSMRAIFTTHRGQTTGGLKQAERKLMKIAEGDVILTTDGESYTINGLVFETDGVRTFLSGASNGREEGDRLQ